MRRYIDADKLLRNLPDDLPYKASVKRVLIQAPEADVVPKSEVEKIFEEIEKHLIFNTYGIATISDKTLAELKKKYTEGKNGA
jgi:hypothetical protein